jgi:hypothetical protein
MSRSTHETNVIASELSREQRSLQNYTRLLNQRFLVRESLLHHYLGRGSTRYLLGGLLRGHKVYKIRCLDSDEFSSRYLIRRSVNGCSFFMYESSGRHLLTIQVDSSADHDSPAPSQTGDTSSTSYTFLNCDLLSCFEKEAVLARFRLQDSEIEVKGLANWNRTQIKREDNWLLFTEEHGSTIARMHHLHQRHRESSEMELYGCTQPESVVLLAIAFLFTM